MAVIDLDVDVAQDFDVGLDVDVDLNVDHFQVQVPSSHVLEACTVRQKVSQPPQATALLDTSVSSWPPPPPPQMVLLVTSVQPVSTALRGLPHLFPAILAPTVLQHRTHR